MTDKGGILVAAITSLLIFFLLLFPVYSQTPTPTPGTPTEWSGWLDEQPDVEMIPAAEFNPVVTVGGTHTMPAATIKQSLAAGAAVLLEHGYSEAVSPIDPEGIGGLRFEGYVAVALTDPVIQLASLGWYLPVMPVYQTKPTPIKPRPTPDHAGPRPRPTPDHAGPRPRPTPLLPENAKRPPVPGAVTLEGKVTRVIITDYDFPGGAEKKAIVVPAVSLLDRPVTGKVEVERIPWDSSYAIRRGRVFYKVEVEK